MVENDTFTRMPRAASTLIMIEVEMCRVFRFSSAVIFVRDV